MASGLRLRASFGASVASFDPGHGDLRALRGGLVGATGVALGLAGHAAAGGPPPNVGAAAALSVLATVVAVRLSRHRWTLPSLVAVLAFAQAMFHVAFLIGSPGATAPAPPAAVPDVAMVVGHIVAAVGMAVLLRYGEDLWWAVAGLLGLHVLPLARPAGLPSLESRRVRPSNLAEEVEPTGLRLARRCSRRGPPTLARESRSS